MFLYISMSISLHLSMKSVTASGSVHGEHQINSSWKQIIRIALTLHSFPGPLMLRFWLSCPFRWNDTWPFAIPCTCSTWEISREQSEWSGEPTKPKFFCSFFCARKLEFLTFFLSALIGWWHVLPPFLTCFSLISTTFAIQWAVKPWKILAFAPCWYPTFTRKDFPSMNYPPLYFSLFPLDSWCSYTFPWAFPCIWVWNQWLPVDQCTVNVKSTLLENRLYGCWVRISFSCKVLFLKCSNAPFLGLGLSLCLKILKRFSLLLLQEALLWKPLVIRFCPLKILSDSFT